MHVHVHLENNVLFPRAQRTEGGCILSGRSTSPPVSRKVLLNPRHPERICWGCEKYCPADDLACGNGTIRTPHPSELFGDDWLEWEAGRAESLQAEPL